MTRHSLKVTIWSCLLCSCAAAQNFTQEQIIRIANPRERFDSRWNYVWDDLDGDGRLDVIVVSPKGDVRIYYQGQSGFGAQPDQSWTMPQGTLWFTVVDAVGDPGREIVVCQSDGIKYYRRHEPRGFDTSPELLVPVPQVFQDRVIESVVFLAANGSPGAFDVRNSGLPVILPDGAKAFVRLGVDSRGVSRQENLQWSYTLSPQKQAGWSSGSTSSYGFQVQRKATVWSDATASTREGVALPEGMHSVQDLASIGLRGTERVDLNGDGRPDEIRWTVSGVFEPATTVEVFAADRDGRYPDQPSQVLRYKGVPFIQENRDHSVLSPSLLRDINGDHLPDMVLLELRSKPVSPGAMLELLMSHQIRWTLTVRVCGAGGHFSPVADASLDVTAMLSLTNFMDVIVLASDMNGDGCPEVIVRTDPSKVEIYYSSSTGPLYAIGRMHPCRLATQGQPVVRDLNADGLADIYAISFEKGEMGMVYQHAAKTQEP